MIPSVLSAQVRRGLEDFLLTTFPVTNPFFAGTLERLLGKKGEVFRGPYLSLKLPFTPATGGPVRFPGILPEGFVPYRHQERAWERLDSTVGLSTLVATGTGSGKTECFLYPILDHCLRHRDKPGIKAILIYPMNALATDQARRLARAIYQNPLLRGNVTAGLYLGQEGPDSKRPGVMSETDLIANREAMRAAPPDILLTNYKMLDYLLIRAQDAGLWKNNAPDTLRYLVVDELHSFDGAQGADLACLIRRVKARVKAPAGQLICVGTSATLGDSRPDSVHDLADYATRVFSEPFTDGSLIGESVLNTDQFLAGQFVRFFHPPDYSRKDDLDPFGYDDMPAYVAAQYRAWFQGEIMEWEDSSWRYQLADRLREHSFLRNLLYILDGKSKDAGLLLEAIAKQVLEFRHADFEYVELLLISFMTLVSQARIAGPQGPQPLINVRYQLWLRELRRMVSRVGTQPDLAFADDLKPDDLKRSLPVIHCRECGITGWGGVVKDADNTLLADLPTFYDSFFSNSQHVRFVFPGMSADGRLPEYLCAECLRISMANTPGPCANCHAPVDRKLRVWVFESTERQTGTGALRGTHNCGACQGVNSLTILGSRAASLTSVLIAQVFGSNFNNDKRMLAFSDNVQDASHRAGFFGARTYAFTLRGALQKSLPGEPVPFTDVARRFLEKWEAELGESQFVATFLPPDMEWLADFNYLRKNGQAPAGSDLTDLVRRRIDWEIWSEYTLDARIGRTLEKTGCSTVEIIPELFDQVAEKLLAILRNELGGLRDLDSATLASFLEGTFQQLKNKGGIEHPDLDAYLDSKGNYYTLGNRIGRLHRPPVGQSSRIPVFLISDSGTRFSHPGPKTWHEAWLKKCFGAIDGNASRFTTETYRHVLRELVTAGIFFEKTVGHARIWGLRREALQVTPQVVQLRCERCSQALSASPAGAERLQGASCSSPVCDGRMSIAEGTEGYYSRMYRSGDTERVFTAEHTGLLSRTTREDVERGFLLHDRPADPNLLSCTPTLEMGINIGDLSSLAMCSVPPKPSNYLQRAGRAGRVDGNAFILALANGRPHDLFFFAEPDEMIQGLVETPGCFLNASAVLERQFTAYCFDRWVETGNSAIPRRMQTALDAIDREEAVAKDQFPWNFLAFFALRQSTLEQSFLAMFDGEIADYTKDHIEGFSRGTGEPNTDLRGSMLESLRRVGDELRGLRRRTRTLGDRVRAMENNPARPQNFEEELEHLRQERDGLSRLARELAEQTVLEFLTDEGLLPNYAFPEAGVTLKSVIIQKKSKPEANGEKYQVFYEKYPRPASAAISELAPANYFHAEKRRLVIDQINLDLSKVEAWRFCDNCSYMHSDLTNDGRQECPQCGSAMWADEGQCRNMLKMRQVISTMTDRDSRSFDETDDREPQFYQKNMFVVRDENEIEQAYFIDNEDVPFGYEFFGRLTLREVNFGEKAASNGQMRIAGRPWADRPFRFCSSCGKIRKKQNEKLEHARYCTFHGKEDRAVEESASFLYREITSEAIRILLPVATTEVEKNLNSFVAALDLGLRKKFRGDPGHLLSTTYDEPIEGSDARKRFLVLYDGVPGGTGYLKELMQQPDTLFEVFQFAHDVLAACPCQHDSTKDGCYRCLLAYHGRHDRLNTSRSAALRLLTLILEHRSDLKRIDRLNSVRMNRLIESELEARFIEALRLPRLGESEWHLSTQVMNGKQGFYLKAPGGNYRIEPQVALGSEQNVCRMSIADFVFYPERPAQGELPLAVFTDGFEYHADAANLRVGADLSQRMAIARSGRFHVWSLTWEDVDAVAKNRQESAFAEGASGLDLLRKFDEKNAPLWSAMHGRTAFEWLLFRLGTGRTLNWELHARAWLASRMNATPRPEGALREVRDSLLRAAETFEVPGTIGNEEPSSFRAAIVRDSSIGYIIRGDLREMRSPELNGLTGTFRLFDEAATGDRLAWKQDWRRFLQWFNVLQFAGPLDFVSSSGLRDGIYGAMLIDDLPLERAIESVVLTDASLLPLLNDLQATGRHLPAAGFELTADDGEIVATAELAWEGLLIAVLMEHEWEGRAKFEERGWKVFRADSVLESNLELFAVIPGEKS
jgi:DEAD/DEAH box helicase domain-containing protein